MYERFFELRERPFADRLDTRAFQATSEREEALAALQCAAQYAPGHILIVGAAGVGKTLLIRTFISRLDNAERALLLTAPATDGPDLIRETCRRLNISCKASAGMDRWLPRLHRQLVQLCRGGRRPILIVDQAERLSAEHLIQVEQLAELTDGGERLLSIVLVGQPQIRELLSTLAFARLRQMMHPELQLGAMALDEVHEYVRRALQAVGFENGNLFSEESLAGLYAESGGVPRLLNRAADAALMAAYGAGQKRVTVISAEGHGPSAMRTVRRPEEVFEQSSMPARITDTLVAEELSESMEPFDWSATAPPARALLIYPPWESQEMDENRRARIGPEGDEEEEMVSIACSAAQAAGVGGDNGHADMETGPEFRLPPQDLLERLEKAVHLFGQVSPPQERVAAVMESRAPDVEAEENRLATLEKRLRNVLAPAEARVAELERRAARLVRPLEQMEERRERTERACEAAQRMETRLTAYAERIAQAAGDLQERSTALASDMEAGDEFRERLSVMMDEAAAAVTGLEARFELNRQNERDMESRTEDARRALARSVREARETHAVMDELVVQASSDHARASARTESLRRELQDMVGSAGEAIKRQQEVIERDMRERLDRVAEEQLRQVHEAAAARDRERTRDDEQLREQRAKWDQAAEAWMQEMQEALQLMKRERGVEEERIVALRKSIIQSLESERDSALKVMQAQYADWRTTWVEELATACRQRDGIMVEAQTFQTQLRGEAENLVGEIRKQANTVTADLRGQLESISARQRAEFESHQMEAETQRLEWAAQQEVMRERQEALVSAQAVEIDALEARCQSLGHQTAAIGAQLGEIGTSLDRTLRQREGVQRGLADSKREMDAMVERGLEMRSQLTESLQACKGMVETAMSTCGQLESWQQSSTRMLVEIGAHCERAQALREQLPGGEEVMTRLGDQLSAAIPMMRQLPDLTESARRGCDALKRMIAETAELSSRCESHRAASATAYRQLSDATIAAHDVLEDLRKSGQSEREAVAASHAEFESLRRTLENQLERATETLQELAAAGVTGMHTLKQLWEDRQAAMSESRALEEHAGRAKQAAKDLLERTTAAETTIEHLEALQPALDNASALEKRIGEAAESAAQLQEALSATSEAAIEQQEILSAWCARTGELTHSGEALEGRLRTSAEQVAQTIKSAEEASATQEESLSAYVKQSTQIVHMLTALQEKFERIQQEMNVSLAQPADILRGAQEQTAQLTAVCTAVRKVFGNLAQTSLQARKDIQAFEERSADAAQRSAILSEETNRAAATLQQWVQEAIHVQGRLEQTLKQSPTLAQTHPGEVLKAVSRLSKPITGMVTMPRPKIDGPSLQESMSQADSLGQPTEIAGILREARQAKSTKPVK